MSRRSIADATARLKYDQLFNNGAKRVLYEASSAPRIRISPAGLATASAGAVASIMLNEPNPAPGTGLTRDELKAALGRTGVRTT